MHIEVMQLLNTDSSHETSYSLCTCLHANTLQWLGYGLPRNPFDLNSNDSTFCMRYYGYSTIVSHSGIIR